jgi:hypothetical protein
MTKLILKGVFQKIPQISYPYRIYSEELYTKCIKDYYMKELATERINKINIISGK